MGKILVVGLDADGCVYHECLRKELRAQSDFAAKLEVIIKNNSPLWDSIDQLIRSADFSKTVVTVVSNRQSARVDHSNSVSGTKPLFLQTIKHIVEYLNKQFHSMPIELDPILLADARSENVGSAFHAATDDSSGMAMFGDRSIASQQDCSHLAEKSKLLLLYMQMHYLSAKYPDDEISFVFYDDMLREVLTPLRTFFTQNAQLMPSNVELILTQYSGVMHDDFVDLKAGAIKGQGRCDKGFFNSIKFLAKLLDIEFKPQGQAHAINELLAHTDILLAWLKWVQTDVLTRNNIAEFEWKKYFPVQIVESKPLATYSIFADRLPRQLALDLSMLQLANDICCSESFHLLSKSPQSPNA